MSSFNLSPGLIEQAHCAEATINNKLIDAFINVLHNLEVWCVLRTGVCSDLLSTLVSPGEV